MTDNEAPKPPTDLMPSPIWEDNVKQERIGDIKAAIRRYDMTNKPVPDDWFIEVGALLAARRRY